MVADPASFTIALRAARDQLVHAAGSLTATAVDLVGVIGRAVRENLLPARRHRSGPRVVKHAISQHRAEGTIDRTSHKTRTSVRVLPRSGRYFFTRELM
jgi:hypothetical protein